MTIYTLHMLKQLHPAYGGMAKTTQWLDSSTSLQKYRHISIFTVHNRATYHSSLLFPWLVSFIVSFVLAFSLIQDRSHNIQLLNTRNNMLFVQVILAFPNLVEFILSLSGMYRLILLLWYQDIKTQQRRFKLKHLFLQLISLD